MSNIDDLINQMGAKRCPNDVNCEKNIKDDKFKKTFKETTMDYYKILGVEPTATQLEIKRAYQSKLKKMHPDKVPQTKENKAKYKLLCEAGDILCNHHERNAYDMQRKMDQTPKDYNSQKDSFKEFKKLQELHLTEENRSIAKLNFERGLADLNRKHGYDDAHIQAIPKEEHDRRIEDMKLQREQEELEIAHDDIFEGTKFNPIVFNKLFETKKKKDEKRKKTHGGLAKYNEDISAFNDIDDAFGGVNIDKYDALYSEDKIDNYGERYGGVGTGMIGNDDVSSGDDISIDSPCNDDYDTHNRGISKETFDTILKRMMEDRNTQDKQFEKMEQKDFGSAIDDKFGISNKLGFMVGNASIAGISGHQKQYKTNKEDTLKTYKQLTSK